MPKKNFFDVEDHLKWFVANLPEVRLKVARADRPDYFDLFYADDWTCGYMYEEQYDGANYQDQLVASNDDLLEALRTLKQRVEEFLAKC